MAIDADAARLMKLDELIKGGLEDEIAVMKSIYTQLVEGLKVVKEVVAKTDFHNATDDTLNRVRQTIDLFTAELDKLEPLDARFASIKEHAISLKERLTEFRNTLSTYNSAEKAIIDMNNNVIYDFKVKLVRDFEQDIEFNKKIEKALG